MFIILFIYLEYIKQVALETILSLQGALTHKRLVTPDLDYYLHSDLICTAPEWKRVLKLLTVICRTLHKTRSSLQLTARRMNTYSKTSHSQGNTNAVTLFLQQPHAMTAKPQTSRKQAVIRYLGIRAFVPVRFPILPSPRLARPQHRALLRIAMN